MLTGGRWLWPAQPPSHDCSLLSPQLTEDWRRCLPLTNVSTVMSLTPTVTFIRWTSWQLSGCTERTPSPPRPPGYGHVGGRWRVRGFLLSRDHRGHSLSTQAGRSNVVREPGLGPNLTANQTILTDSFVFQLFWIIKSGGEASAGRTSLCGAELPLSLMFY